MARKLAASLPVAVMKSVDKVNSEERAHAALLASRRQNLVLQDQMLQRDEADFWAVIHQKYGPDCTNVNGDTGIITRTKAKA